MRLSRLPAAIVLLASACQTQSEFNCQENQDCSQDGVCEPTGFCSFPDRDCESGRRYGQLAGTGLANQCVTPSNGTSTSGTTVEASGTTSTGDSTDTSEDLGSSTGTPDPVTEDFCEPLASPDGDDVIEIGPKDLATLQSQLDNAEEGTTFLVAPGEYVVPDGIRVNTAGITIRSADGDPDSVVFLNSTPPSSVFHISASDVTIAELSIRTPGAYGVFVSTNGTEAGRGTLLYRLHIIDPGIAGVRITYDNAPIDDGVVACSTIELTDDGRASENCGTKMGISGIGAAGWDIRDNLVQGFWCPEGVAKPAIGFSQTSFDNIIRRNQVRESFVGIRLGDAEERMDIRTPPDHGCSAGYYGSLGGAVVNNMVSATGTGIGSSNLVFDSGIATWQVCETLVAHNTVVSTFDGSSIEYRFDRTEVSVLNNLVSGEIVVRNDAGAPVAGNITEAELNMFVSPLSGDLHLLEGAAPIDAGVNLGSDALMHDIDGEPRVDAPDVGADEAVQE